MNSPIICETQDEFNRDGICEGCNENAGEECSSCDNIACSECIEEFTTDEDDKRCRICAGDEPDTEEEEEEEEDEYDFESYGIKRIYKVIIQVAGGGLGNGNAYATVEGEWACEDDFANGEDGEIHYCEYGNNPKREWRGVRLRYSDDGNLFKIEE